MKDLPTLAFYLEAQMRGLLLIGVALGFGIIGQATLLAGDKLPSSSDVRKAIENSLPYLEKDGVAWINKRGCHSCHHVPFMLWSFNAAKALGIAVDEKKLAEWKEWSRTQPQNKPYFFRLTAGPFKTLPGDLQPGLQKLHDKPFHTEKEFIDAVSKALPGPELTKNKLVILEKASVLKQGGVNGPGLVDVMSPVLLGLDRSDKSTEQAAFVKATLDAIPEWREQSGRWSSGNQLYGRRWGRPIAEQVTTMWALLALGRHEASDPRFKKSLAAMQEVLKTGKPDLNIEWLVVRLLFEHRFGSPERITAFRDELRKRQNGDGGWSVFPAGPSDAFSTGQTLYALRLTGVAGTDSSIRNAQRYLLETQLKNGAWPNPAASVSATTDKARIKRLDIIYGYWGSAWASIGLSQSLAK